MNLRTLSLAIVLIGVCSNPARAQLLNFEFTTTADPTYVLGGFNPIAGTITGEILGLQNNGATVRPTDILIFSLPAQFGITASPSSPYSLFVGHGYFSSGSFQVSGGNIQSGTVFLAIPPASPNGVLFLYLNGGSTYNGLISTTGPPPGYSALNGGGFAGTTYIPTAQYDLGATVGSGRVISGGSTSVTATITNIGTGTADSLYFTGLTTNGSLSGGTLPLSGGPVANNGGTASGSATLSVGTTTGIQTITPTVGTATNATVGGNDTLNSTGTTTVDVVTNRLVTSTSVALGRVMVGQSVSGISTLSTTGDDADFTRVTVGTAGPDANGISATGGTDPTFNSGSVTDSRTVGGAFTSAGNTSGTLTLVTTGEGLTGESPINVALAYTADPVANRVVTASSVALGRVIVGQSVSGASTLSTTGDDANFTRVTVGTAGPDANGISATGGTDPVFNSATVTDTRIVGGTFGTAGSTSGNFTLVTTGEGLTGESPINVSLAYTADAVNKRVITNGVTTDFGTLHSGAAISATSSAFTTTGTHDTTTDVTVAAGSGGTDGNGVSLSGGPTAFNGTLSSDTRAFGGNITSASGGTTSGAFNLGITGEGLVGEGSYNPVEVSYTAFVYTGQGVWNTNGSGSWGTVSATPANWTANGGTPGLDSSFTSTDSATFGNTLTSGTANVTLDGDNPSLNAITFNDSAASYNLAQGTGGSITLNGGAGSATVTDLAGIHDISAPVILATGANVNVTSGQELIISGNVSGNGGLTMSAGGSTVLSGVNIYTGGTTINAGTLTVENPQALGTGFVRLNGGTLMMGPGNRTLTDFGNYQQNTGNGTLLIAINNAGNDVVNLPTGQAMLGAGTLEVNLAGLTAAPLGSAKTTQKYAVLTTTQTINGQFTNFTVENNAAGVNAVADYVTNPDEVYVDLTSPGALFSTLGLTPNQRAIVNNINNALNGGIGSPLFLSLGNAVTNNPGAEGGYLDQLSPQAFAQFTSQTAFNNASFETEAMDNYLAGQCNGLHGTFTGGNGQIDASGLAINDPSYDSNLAMIHSRLLAWNPGPPDGTVSDTANPLFAGMEMSDSKDMKSMVSPAYTDPWNFFVRGNVILAQGFSGQDVGHFNDNTESVVLGTDYRITPNFLIGVTAGYGHTDVTLDNNGSSATVDSYSPGVYASYANKGWCANASGNYVHNAYTQNRVIGFLGQTAKSAPEGNQGTANLDGGYDFHHGAFTFGPLAGLQYTHLTVDGYNETGSIGDLSVNNDQSDSLRSRFGGRLSYAFSDCGMTFTPHLDASWQHEFMDQGRGITSQFEGIGAGSFSVRTVNSSRDSALVNAGFDAKFNRTVTAFVDYTVQAGQDNYFGQSVQAGVKIGF